MYNTPPPYMETLTEPQPNSQDDILIFYIHHEPNSHPFSNNSSESRHTISEEP